MDAKTWAEKRLENWKKAHLQGKGKSQIVKRYGRPVSLIRMDEFTDTRLTFQDATNELLEIIHDFVATALEELALKIGESAMPPQVACDEYKSQSVQVVRQYVDVFRGHIASLRAAVRDRWDEGERQFSEDEIDDFSRSFRSAVNRLRKESVSVFKLRTWHKPKTQPTVTSIGTKHKTDRMPQRKKTMQESPQTKLGRNINRLRKECGWSFDLLAEKTKLDKKLILGHVT